MSFIKHSVPPPELKEGETLLATILDMRYPVEGKYKPQIEWQIQLDKEHDKYDAKMWTTFYEEPSDKSILGRLCITYMNFAKGAYGKVSEVLEAIRRHGKIFVKVTGFREWNEKLYPKFQVNPTKLPGEYSPAKVQPTLPTSQPGPIPLETKIEDPAIYAVVKKLKEMPPEEREKEIKRLAGLV